MADFEDQRKPSAVPCIYWDGTRCIANQYFSEDSITCFNDSNCDGFGTCRGCSKYNQGGLKLSEKAIDSEGNAIDQTPMNLLVYNVRARIAPCCFWDGSTVDFSKAVDEDRTPVFKTNFQVEQFIETEGDTTTKCTLAAAAPWQVGFTEENQTPYGCNGAKAECPFYTGPQFTEVVDEKMDLGNRVTAKQIMELRFYSDNWKSYPDPRAEYESRFDQPDIWAWARDETSTTLPGGGIYDTFGNPMIEKVTLGDLTGDTPSYSISAPITISTGTPTVGGPPDFPTLVRKLSLLPAGMKVLFPQGTSSTEPFVRNTFTVGERNMWVSVQINSDRSVYAVNLSKHPQQGKTDAQFIADIKKSNPEDVIPPITSGLPASTFAVPLVLNGKRELTNHIKIFLDTGSEDGSMLTANIYVRHVFHHAHVAQTTFKDFYGHSQIDPWINHFTDIEIEADFLNLTNNVSVHDVLWHTLTTEGKKTIYAIEEQVEEADDAEDPQVEWESIGCGYILVKFNDPNINRVFPWKAWGEDAKGASLYVKFDRSDNPDITSTEATEVELELAFASTKGTAIPPNMAIFKTAGNNKVRPFAHKKDVLKVRYAYTEYKQGPIADEDITKLKFPEDITRVNDQMVYGVTFDQSGMRVEGTFIDVNGRHINSCDQLLGDCYTDAALENEEQAVTVFFAGGIGESSIQSHEEMVVSCVEEFESQSSGTFEDGTPITYAEAVNRLTNKHLKEGDQKYLVIFKDRTGRPVGIKYPAFLMQSAVVQTRDVEIRYKWGAHMQHYPTRDGMILLAIFHKPIFATQDRLVRLIQEYDPYCGDHAETTSAQSGYTAFDLNIDKHGPLWYPYKRCLTPQYHSDNSVFSNVVEYEDTVEGFGAIPGGVNATGHRRDYWEKMRFWDQYMPAVMNFIPQVGCFWSERTTTINANRPVVFTGYTKIRSGHPFGPYATDRESIRISRHWEKRNLAFSEESIVQEEDGVTIKLTDEYESALYDANTGDLIDGEEAETPIWVHINDGLSIVNPATEAVEHPFAHLTLNRVGPIIYNEVVNTNDRLRVSSVFVERDYTSNLLRNEDGTQIYLADGTELNTEESDSTFVEEQKGQDIRWAFKNKETSWAWLPEPDDPVRGANRITGLFVSNPARVLFKKNRQPATHTLEGQHLLTYTPHQFTPEGLIESSAAISLDGGPELLISQTDGDVFILGEGPVFSPYDVDAHAGEDYQFVLHGNGPNGVGILADNRGLQRYEVAGVKYATLAGINVNTNFDLDELPYELVDIRSIDRLSGVTPEAEEGEPPPDPNPDETSKITEAIKAYTDDEIVPFTIPINLHGHYFIESVVIDFVIGPKFDIPVVKLTGQIKESGQATASEAEVAIELLNPTSYQDGVNYEQDKSKREVFSINRRLFNLTLSFGSRKVKRRLNIQSIIINVRNPVAREEVITVFEPRVHVSTADPGTHKPSDLEFYYQRSYPDFSKSYLAGTLSVGDLTQLQGITAVPRTEIKFTGRRIKDIIPTYDFTDPINNRFPYNNIDITAIQGYAETADTFGTFKYINQEISTSSKGWTMVTGPHHLDTGYSNVPTDFGPNGVANVYEGNLPVESLQEELYRSGSALGGDKISLYSSFWHPKEIEFFEDSGVDLSEFTWFLTLQSTVAPINRVFRDQNYGCRPQNTNENLDGALHRIPNWQAKGVFHYHCDARFSWSCLTTVMNKCNEFIFRDYGSDPYLDNNVVDRFTYVFAFPPRDYASYLSAGLINRDEIGGTVGGTGPIGSAAFASAPAPSYWQLVNEYDTNLYDVIIPPKGSGPYQ